LLESVGTDLYCSTIGVNRMDAADANILISDRSLVWVQDTEQDDVWAKWGVTYRDVRIVDGAGNHIGTYNLTQNDLGVPDNSLALAEMILAASVLPDEDQDKLNDDWERTEFGDLDTANSTTASQVVAYGLGPARVPRAPHIELRTVKIEGKQHVELHFNTRMGTAGGLVYRPEESIDGENWSDASDKYFLAAPPSPLFEGRALQSVIFRSREPINAPVRLIRIRVLSP
jgi:hypothetical protein